MVAARAAIFNTPGWASEGRDSGHAACTGHQTGSIGKTRVSTILAQYLAAKDALPLRCYDTDQKNATFSRYKALGVKHVAVMTDSRNIDPKRFDALTL